MDPKLIEDLVKIFGPVGGLALFVLWLGSREIWVYGKRYRELKVERDELFGMVVKGTTVAEKSTDNASDLTGASRELFRYVQYLEQELEAQRAGMPSKPRPKDPKIPGRRQGR